MLGFASTVIGVAGGLIGSGSDPKTDAKRLEIIASLKQEAVSFGIGSRPYVQLQCWAGIDSPEAVTYGFRQPSGPACRVGSDTALAAAKLAFAEVQARLKVGPALASLGVTALGAANAVQPGAGTSALGQKLTESVGGVPTLVLVAGLGVVLWLVLRK